MSTPSKEQFFKELDENTYCGYTWCRNLYGYTMYDCDAEFLKKVYNRLEELGRSNVKYIYGVYFKTQIAYEREQEKTAAKLVRERIDREYEREVKENSNANRNWHEFKGFPPI